MGYSLEWVASEIGVKPRRISWWINRGLFADLPPIGRGNKEGYSLDFIDRALVIHEWLQLYPRGPLENLRDLLIPEPEDEEEDAA